VSPLSDADVAALREYGVVVFAGRVIYDAQPPMPAQRLAEIAAVCAGPLPTRLVDLWRLTAGGRLDYALSAPLRGQLQELSWAELFYDCSDGYRDLAGWIEYDLELTEEVAQTNGQAWDGRLTHLPIGGFEYLERVYVAVEPGPHHGEVVVWQQGLPPAWGDHRTGDAMATLGADLDATFAALRLPVNPVTAASEHAAGLEFLQYVDENVPGGLAERVIAFFVAALDDR
jgi:hypothetical protein